MTIASGRRYLDWWLAKEGRRSKAVNENRTACRKFLQEKNSPTAPRHKKKAAQLAAPA